MQKSKAHSAHFSKIYDFSTIRLIIWYYINPCSVVIGAVSIARIHLYADVCNSIHYTTLYIIFFNLVNELHLTIVFSVQQYNSAIDVNRVYSVDWRACGAFAINSIPLLYFTFRLVLLCFALLRFSSVQFISV